MKRMLFLTSALASIAFSAPDEGAPAAPAPAETKPAKPKLESRNGVSRPAAGSKTAQVWDIADKISAEAKRPALREEVMSAGEKAGLNRGTIATQYARWTEFFGVTKEQRSAAREASKPATAAPAGEPAPVATPPATE